MNFEKLREWSKGIDKEALERAKNEPLPVRVIRFTAAGLIAATVFLTIVGISGTLLMGLLI